MAEVRSFGRVKVIIGERNGKYPHGNSILIEDDITALIDSSQTVYEMCGKVTDRPVDILINSHYHEDHWIGNHWFPEVPLHIHALDAPAMRSLATLFDYYGMDEAANEIWKPVLVEKYHYQPCQYRKNLEKYFPGTSFSIHVPRPGF